MTAIPTELAAGFGTLANATGGKAWRASAEVLYNYLRRDMSDARTQRLALYPKHGDEHVLRTVPLVWRMSRELATLYMRPPERTRIGLDGEPFAAPVEERVRAVYDGARVNRKMRMAHEQLVATGNATIWVWPLSTDTVTGVQVLVIPPHLQAVEYRALSHHERDVVRWWIKRPVVVDAMTGMVEYAVGEITQTTAVWVDGPADLRGKGIWADDGSNPLGQIPVIMLRASDPAPHEWWAPVPEDLLDAQRAINHDLTDVGEVARRQGFGQPVLTEQGRAEAELETGPETAVHIRDPQGKFEFARPGADIKGMLEAAEQYIRTVVAHHGLNPATYLRSAGITALAKQIELVDREMERERHAEEFVRAEVRLYSLIRQWLGIVRGGGEPLWPAASNVRMGWRIVEPPADPQGDATAAETEDRIGLMGVARRRAKREGISLAEAQARVLEDRALSREAADPVAP